MYSLGNKAISNMTWKFLEGVSSHLIGLIVTLVLARLLAPDDYGVVAIVTIFISICNVLMTQGFGSALIQKQDADEKDFSSMFYMALMISIVLYLILFFSAPLISNYFGESYAVLSPALRIMGLQIIVYSYNTIQQAYVSRHLIFKKSFYTAAIGTILSGVIGIVMAVKGLGVYALVAQSLSNAVINTILLYLVVRWLPTLYFSFTRIKKMLVYSSRLVLSGLIEKVYTELRSFIIGKKYSASDLAYYNQGNRLPDLIDGNIQASINAVLFPIMSNHQNNRDEIIAMCRRAVGVSSFVLFPILLLFYLVSEDLILLILTDKWQGCIIYTQIFCLVHMFYPISTTTLQAIKAIGNSRMYLNIDITKKCLGLIILLFTMWHGALWIALGMLLCTFINLFINMLGVQKVIHYRLKDQLNDFSSNLLITISAFGLTYFVPSLIDNCFLSIVITVLIFSMAYVGLASLTKNKNLSYIKQLIYNRKNANK